MSVQPQLGSNTVVARAEGFLEAEIDGEIVSLNIEKGTCYGLNRVGSRIWALIEAPMSIGQICAKLTDEYDVDSATCERQVLDLLEDMRAEGMITGR